MIVHFMCDCCDEIFDHIETLDELEPEELSALTGHRIGSIIKNSNQTSELYIDSTCDECTKSLMMDDETEEFSYIRPVIN